MSIQAVDGTNLYVVYFWNGYDSDFAVSCVCATERKAKEEYRRRNKEYLEDAYSECISEEGDVIWDETSSDSCYYYYVGTRLII